MFLQYLICPCEFEFRSWRGVLDTTLCDKVCQWLATGLLFSTGTPVSSTNKTVLHDIAQILLKVALSTITPLICPLRFPHTNGCSIRLYLQLFLGGIMSYLGYLCLFTYSGVQHILGCVFCLFVLFVFVLCLVYDGDTFCFICFRLVYPMLPVPRECPFLIAHSVFSDVSYLDWSLGQEWGKLMFYFYFADSWHTYFYLVN